MSPGLPVFHRAGSMSFASSRSFSVAPKLLTWRQNIRRKQKRTTSLKCSIHLRISIGLSSLPYLMFPVPSFAEKVVVLNPRPWSRRQPNKNTALMSTHQCLMSRQWNPSIKKAAKLSRRLQKYVTNSTYQFITIARIVCVCVCVCVCPIILPRLLGSP